MKQCPVCNRIYPDTLKFCRTDGAELAIASESATAILAADDQSVAGATFTSPIVPSIAVLPFVNLSAEPDNEYFCDGLAEELINALSKTGELKVAARTSAFSFRDKDVTINDIGRALNVGAVLEGGVRKAGNRLRVTVQLINVSDGYQLWSGRYDRQIENVFAVQDEITLAIVGALEIELLGEEKAEMLRHYTEDTRAYELLLKGRYYHNKFTPDDWKRAIAYFDEAVAREPEYALAYAWKAMSLSALSYFGLLAPSEVLPQWEAAANRALEIDAHLAEAHLTLAQHRFYHDWNWPEAETEFRKAIALNPNSAEAEQYFGLFLATRGRVEEAIVHARHALDLDPLSLLTIMQVGWTFVSGNLLDDALRMSDAMIEVEPNFFGAYWLLGAVKLGQGEYSEAIEALQKSLALAPNLLALSQLGSAYGTIGKRDEALAVLNQLMEMSAQCYVAPYNIARIHSGLGDNDRAFEWLEKAFEEHNGEMVFLRGELENGTGDTFGKSISSDPRLPGLLKRIEGSTSN